MKDRSIKAYIGNSKRGDIVPREALGQPGPGNYDSHSRGGGPNYTIGERRTSQIRDSSPGAGSYSPNDRLVKSRSQFANIGGT